MVLDISGDETLIPLLRAVFGENVAIEHWRGGAKQLSGPCRDGSIHDGYAATINGVGHWLCRKCGQELCATSGGCIVPEEGEPWRL